MLTPETTKELYGRKSPKLPFGQELALDKLVAMLCCQPYPPHVTSLPSHSPPTDSRSGRGEKELDEEVAHYKGLMLAVSTQRAYRSQLKSFLSFCTTFGYSPVSVSDSTLCRYVAFLGRTLKCNSVRQYLSAIRILHLECNLPNPVLDNWALGTVLKGMRRDKGSQVTTKVSDDTQVATFPTLHIMLIRPIKSHLLGILSYYVFRCAQEV